MTTGVHNPLVVAGVDGSTSAMNAACWAAKEAARRGADLRLVHADIWPLVRHPPVASVPGQYHHALREQAEHYLQAAREAAASAAPAQTISTELVTGAATEVLIRESASAALVVLGSRGLGGFSGLLVGSTAVALAAHGHCPVVVVRGPTPDSPPLEHGPVVLGVDGSPASERATEFAFAAAATRGAPLVAVHTWTDTSTGTVFGLTGVSVDWESLLAEEERVLADNLAIWQSRYPQVPVRALVTMDRPVRSLLEQSTGAQLLVVGSRGRGGFTGMLLGSTSQALLHHAVCPVAVVRASVRI